MNQNFGFPIAVAGQGSIARPQPTAPISTPATSPGNALGFLPEGSYKGVDADKLQTGITREQYNDWVTSYVPHENDHIGRLQDDQYYAGQVREAGVQAGRGFDIGQGSLERNLSRYGVNLNPDQQRVLDRIRKFGRDEAVVHAKNTARDRYEDLRLGGLNTVANLAQAQAADAAGIASNVAAADAQRKATNDQIKAQSRQAALGAVSTAATLAVLGGI